MSMIDWSDPEEMLGLLAEYLHDELHDEHRDDKRADFLEDLSAAIDELASHTETPTRTVLAALREIYDEQPAEFADDPVMTHVNDCIAELSRILAHSK